MCSVITRQMNKLIVGYAAGVSLASLATTTFSGDPNAAKAIIVEHCVKCHVVPGYRPDGGTASVAAPSFAEFAELRETYTQDRLRSFLRAPHWPMTQFILSNSDIDNLISFIESLRDGENLPSR